MADEVEVRFIGGSLDGKTAPVPLSPVTGLPRRELENETGERYRLAFDQAIGTGGTEYRNLRYVLVR